MGHLSAGKVSVNNLRPRRANRHSAAEDRDAGLIVEATGLQGLLERKNKLALWAGAADATHGGTHCSAGRRIGADGQQLANHLRGARGGGGVVFCSALRMQDQQLQELSCSLAWRFLDVDEQVSGAAAADPAAGSHFS